ncbi:Inorganic pyrophosphatase [Waddlia chondrophila 2032/99]|uniref:inorganic diphosphatase n=2 Tax=Waddlia chondrophila TaxID=71667 RepID=D6YU93_WADCW|nr:inorganic pyrophosphatase [Waddlia chondrophila]ADI37704.1 Inorganic pyrophosphatase [Waddlia chondrophila WSU 86-1044]CCB90952.1 Inorganic pyrophosphatase [Waddlia chondrophila 2032/99]
MQNLVKHRRSHPWHGLPLGKKAPEEINCFIEIVPSDTIKYELDKETGLLKIDRPQKFSSVCPTLYGFVPRTYAGNLSAAHCMEKTGLKGIKGDGDPIDICVLTEKMIPRGDIMLRAIPIGGFRMIDGNEADDKLISVLVDDFVYGGMKDLSDCPPALIERLRHYFLTYKDYPGAEPRKVVIAHDYGFHEAIEVIKCGIQDYSDKFSID